jgi:replication fork clamp-binding protein CrfC
MNHDQMYTHPEVFSEAIIYFIENGYFGSYFYETKPVADPFIKHKP